MGHWTSSLIMACLLPTTLGLGQAQGGKILPWELSFKQLWNKRYVFDLGLPLPEGMTFLPYAVYTSEVTSLPAEMTLETQDGTVLVRYPAPDTVKPPYTMHLYGAFVLYVTKDGVTTYMGVRARPAKTNMWNMEATSKFVLKGRGGMSQPVASLTAGAGQADLRFVTRGRENALYWEDGRLFFTFSPRGGTGCFTVGSIEPKTLDIRLEGVILFDHHDGRLRGDIAGHVFYDEETEQWRAWVSNFGSPNGREPGGINVAWSRQNPLHGVQVMEAKSLGLTGMHEDPCGTWDSAAKKWRLYLCKFVSGGIRGQMLESDNWDGPYTPLTEPVPDDSTGTTITTIDGVKYCFAGSASKAMYVYSYPELKKLGKMKLLPEPWGETELKTPWGPRKTNNARVWPCLAELPDGYPYKYFMLTFDRINIPGWKDPNWTYGGMYIYGANPGTMNTK